MIQDAVKAAVGASKLAFAFAEHGKGRRHREGQGKRDGPLGEHEYDEHGLANASG